MQITAVQALRNKYRKFFEFLFECLCVSSGTDVNGTIVSQAHSFQ